MINVALCTSRRLGSCDTMASKPILTKANKRTPIQESRTLQGTEYSGASGIGTGCISSGSTSFSQLAINKPLTLALVHIFHGTVVVNIKDLSCIHFYSEIKSAHIQ